MHLSSVVHIFYYRNSSENENLLPAVAVAAVSVVGAVIAEVLHEVPVGVLVVVPTEELAMEVRTTA